MNKIVYTSKNNARRKINSWVREKSKRGWKKRTKERKIVAAEDKRGEDGEKREEEVERSREEDEETDGCHP